MSDLAELTKPHPKTGRTLIERIADYVSVGDGCWEWCGPLDRGPAKYRNKGYGRYTWVVAGCKGHIQPHRAMYEYFVGPIPPGLQIDHLCRNSPCVRPDHLEAVTGRENVLRGETLPAQLAARAACNYGHPFDAENTRYRPDGRGRVCRECDRLRSQTPARRIPRGKNRQRKLHV